MKSIFYRTAVVLAAVAILAACKPADKLQVTPVNALPDGEFSERRITSYNVCYTKLLRSTDWEKVLSGINVDRTVTLPDGITPGMKAGQTLLREFISRGLDVYPSDRNDPLAEATSGLSPYLHFGQLSAQRVALEVSRADSTQEAKAAFLEELIVRRELADNFCFYQKDYDSVGAFHPWAAASLEAHRDDEREYLYSREEFEFARTHDPLWNAAQIRLLVRGSMHGYT